MLDTRFQGLHEQERPIARREDEKNHPHKIAKIAECFSK